MGLNVQNDDGTVVNANGYIPVADFKAYHDDRGNSYVGFSDTQLAHAIVLATDFVDQRFRYKGVRLTTTQTTEWPRKAGTEVLIPVFDINFMDPIIDEDPSMGNFVAIVDINGNDVVGIPTAVKRATFEYALRALAQPLFRDAPAPVGGRLIDEHTVKVDVIEETIKFTPPQSGAFAMPAFPAADMWLVRAGLVNSTRNLTR